jgi:hypothetical protein
MLKLVNCEVISKDDAGHVVTGDAYGYYIDGGYNVEFTGCKAEVQGSVSSKGIYLKAADNTAELSIQGGNIKINDGQSSGLAYGIEVYYPSASFIGSCIINGTKVKVDVTDTGSNHYGLRVRLDHGEFHGIDIDMVNSDAKDICVKLESGANNNSVSGNYFRNYGSWISNDGENNATAPNTVEGARIPLGANGVAQSLGL